MVLVFAWLILPFLAACSTWEVSIERTATPDQVIAVAPTNTPMPGQTGDSVGAASLIQEEAERYEAADFGGFIRALQAIVADRRDRALADAPDLDYSMPPKSCS